MLTEFFFDPIKFPTQIFFTPRKFPTQFFLPTFFGGGGLKKNVDKNLVLLKKNRKKNQLFSTKQPNSIITINGFDIIVN